MNKKIIIIICLALVAFAANAQTITDELRRDKAGQGHVIINQSVEIERLVNGVTVPQNNAVTQTTEKTEKTENKNRLADKTDVTVIDRPNDRTNTNVAGRPEEKHDATLAEKPADKPSETTSETHTEKPAERRIASTTREAEEGEDVVVNTNKKIMRHSYKATGYRIQAYSGGNKREDRAKCEQIGARIKASFPDMPVYVHFYSPSWKCRVGNFTDMGEAKQVLKKIRAMGYNQACLVKGTINVQY